MNYKVELKTKKLNLTPYALYKISRAFYKAAKNYDSNEYFLVNLFFYGASIEIGLKSAILSINNSDERKNFVHYKIGHDLNKCVEEFNKSYKDQEIITAIDEIYISKLNKYYKEKGLEYCTGDVILALANGGKDFPEMINIEKISDKITSFLDSKKDEILNS